MKKRSIIVGLLAIVVIAGTVFMVFNPELLQGRFGSGTQLEFSLASSPVSDTQIIDTEDIYFLGFNVECKKAVGSCIIDSLTFQGYLDEDGGVDSFATSSASAAHGGDLSNYVTNVRIVDSSGTVLMGPQDPSSSYRLEFADEVSIPASSTVTWYVLGDISADAFADDDAENIAFGIASIKDVSLKGTFSSILKIKGLVNTDQSVYVETAQGVKVTLASSPVSQTVSAGDSEVSMVGFLFECASHDDCEIKDIEFRTDIDDPSYVSDINLKESLSGSVIAGPVNLDVMQRAVFTDDWYFSSWATQTIYLYADIDTGASGNIVFYLSDAETDVNAETTSGDTLLAEGSPNSDSRVVVEVR